MPAESARGNGVHAPVPSHVAGRSANREGLALEILLPLGRGGSYGIDLRSRERVNERLGPFAFRQKSERIKTPDLHLRPSSAGHVARNLERLQSGTRAVRINPVRPVSGIGVRLEDGLAARERGFRSASRFYGNRVDLSVEFREIRHDRLHERRGDRFSGFRVRKVQRSPCVRRRNRADGSESGQSECRSIHRGRAHALERLFHVSDGKV